MKSSAVAQLQRDLSAYDKLDASLQASALLSLEKKWSRPIKELRDMLDNVEKHARSNLPVKYRQQLRLEGGHFSENDLIAYYNIGVDCYGLGKIMCALIEELAEQKGFDIFKRVGDRGRLLTVDAPE